VKREKAIARGNWGKPEEVESGGLGQVNIKGGPLDGRKMNTLINAQQKVGKSVIRRTKRRKRVDKSHFHDPKTKGGEETASR